MKLSKLVLAAVAAIALVGAAGISHATTLSITSGSCSGSTMIGSGFGMGGSPSNGYCAFGPFAGALLVGTGTDGGIVIGSAQTGGGQGTSTSGSATMTTPGGIDGAWFFGGNYGTDSQNGTNTFVTTPGTCTTGTCTAYGTVMSSWDVNWNGSMIPMGGGIIDLWTVVGTAYSLDYRATVPTSVPGFGGYPYALHLEGSIITGPPVPEPASLLLLGTGLLITGTVARRFIKK